MTKEEFLTSLKAEGFPEPVLVEQPANGALGIHRHDFEVKALVIEGSIEIDLSGKISTFSNGDIFYLSYQEPHAEKYSAQGVKYLASRKLI